MPDDDDLVNLLPKYYEKMIDQSILKFKGILGPKPRWMPRFVYRWFCKHCIYFEPDWKSTKEI